MVTYVLTWSDGARSLSVADKRQALAMARRVGATIERVAPLVRLVGVAADRPLFKIGRDTYR